MKKKFMYSFFPLLSAGMLSAGVASAHGFGMEMNGVPQDIATRFQNEAALLGVSIDEVKAAWASGKSPLDVATAHGITKEQLAQKMKDQRAAEMKTKLQALVTQGVITQAQADQRLAFMQAQAAKQKTEGNKKGRGIGFGRGGRHGGDF